MGTFIPRLILLEFPIVLTHWPDVRRTIFEGLAGTLLEHGGEDASSWRMWDANGSQSGVPFPHSFTMLGEAAKEIASQDLCVAMAFAACPPSLKGLSIHM